VSRRALSMTKLQQMGERELKHTPNVSRR
jgi:hypothetical protein